MPANEVSTLPNASYPYSPHFQSLTAVFIREQQQQQQTGPGPAEIEDDYIRHLLDLEEREAYWREREEKLKKELEATQAYLRHIREELGELEGVTDEDEDEDN
ncbi:hypothetical protein AnigIFM50267_001018 [Aspergillus niger]|nr:hypothetical protein AnigIFM50267_001018 [Aspergillus niger]